MKSVDFIYNKKECVNIQSSGVSKSFSDQWEFTTFQFNSIKTSGCMGYPLQLLFQKTIQIPAQNVTKVIRLLFTFVINNFFSKCNRLKHLIHGKTGLREDSCDSTEVRLVHQTLSHCTFVTIQR